MFSSSAPDRAGFSLGAARQDIPHSASLNADPNTLVVVIRISCGDSEQEFVLPESEQRVFNHSREQVPASPHDGVKTWRELSLGVVSLSHGRHEIRIVGVTRTGLKFAEIESFKIWSVH